MQQEDSFEQYKQSLEKQLGISSLLKPPVKPMNAYMRYFLQRSSQERAKGQSNLRELSTMISAEWNILPHKKKEYYQQIYEIRSRQRDALLVQYQLLSNNTVVSPYSKFIKKRYLQYSKEYKTLSSLEITKLANEDWKKLSIKEKDRLRQQYENQKIDNELNIDRTDQINQYIQHLERYHSQLEDDKNRVLRKYGLTAEFKDQLKIDQKERRLQTKRMLKYCRQEFKKEARKKSRRLAKLKLENQRERVCKIREDQIEEEQRTLRATLREQREKVKAQKKVQKKQETVQKEEIFKKEANQRSIGKAQQTNNREIVKKNKVIGKKQMKKTKRRL